MTVAAGLSDLIIRPSVKHQLEQYLQYPAHALMLVGQVGVGLGTIAKSMANQLAGSNVVYLSPTLHNKQKTKIINVDDISFLLSILHDKRNQRLAIIIDDADQTAPGVFERMLKLIEEPVNGVNYIFTTHVVNRIPTTIISRCNLINVFCPSASSCQDLYNNLDTRKVAQIKFMVADRPAQIAKLVTDEDLFEQRTKQISLAKDFVAGALLERLQVVDTVADRQAACNLCSDIALLLQAASHDLSSRAAIQLSHRLDLLADVSDSLRSNGNVRLQLINLVCHF